MDVRVFSIGEAAEASGLTVKTIRYCEQAGVIPKAARHDSGARTGGNRVFGQADIGRLSFIHHARMLDLSLGDIRNLLAVVDERRCPGDQPGYQRILARHHEKIEGLMSRKASRDGEACSWDTCQGMRSGEAGDAERRAVRE